MLRSGTLLAPVSVANLVKLGKSILLIALSLSGFLIGLPLQNTTASSNATNSSTPRPADPAAQLPQTVGADPVPDLRLPRAQLSEVDDAIGEGGVDEFSPDNMTLYNNAVVMRLLGGRDPYDQILTRSGRVLTTIMSWRVEALVGRSWIPLGFDASSLLVLGTNRSGTSVLRTSRVGFGPYHGTFRVVYKATASGPLKWDLEFTPDTPSVYRIVHNWSNVTEHSHAILLASSKRFSAYYENSNYTFSWNDVPYDYPVTAGLKDGSFSLIIDIGFVTTGNAVRIDPSIVSDLGDGTPLLPSIPYTFQRRVFYDTQSSKYWVFYYDGYHIRYKYSSDGKAWFPSTAYTLSYQWATDETSLPGIFVQGNNIVVAWGSNVPERTLPGNGARFELSLSYIQGVIYPTSIAWSNSNTISLFNSSCTYSTGCTASGGVRYVSFAFDSQGMPSYSYNLYLHWTPNFADGHSCQDGGINDSQIQSNSTLYFVYRWKRTILVSNYRVLYSHDCNRYDMTDMLPAILLPASSTGGFQVVFQHPMYAWAQNKLTVDVDCAGNGAPSSNTEMCMEKFDSAGNELQRSASAIVMDQNVVAGTEFSAVSDGDYGVHVVYRVPDGTVTEAYQPAIGLSDAWTLTRNIFGVNPVGYPTLTIDYSTYRLYAFAIFLSGWVVMKTKTPGQSWANASLITLTTLMQVVSNLGSNVASFSGSPASQVSLVWTYGPTGATRYYVEFLAFPINVVWSPFSTPSDPWDGNGIAPFGEYFTNLGEQVSTSIGTLTTRQTDLSIPGRGLNLDVTRVYTQPLVFGKDGNPGNYENYPWAPLGNGWQLNFPWFSNSPTPAYLHLWNGEGYVVPSSFWTGTGIWENHQGENFRLVRNGDNTLSLFSKEGIMYNFDSAHKLTSISDQTSNNMIYFGYDANGRISTITDTVARTFQFCYNAGGLLKSVNQTIGTCGSSIGSIRGVTYSYAGSALTTVTDPAGRATGYEYAPQTGCTGYPNINSCYVNGPWLISKIRYPTGWSTGYNYNPFVPGTGDYNFLYRVSSQTVNSNIGQIRSFQYIYNAGPGDQVLGSTVTSFNGTQVVGYTDYAFSFAGMTRNESNASHHLLRGVQELFDPRGNMVKEINFVANSSGAIGSYTNYYSYDLWGNLIYTRKTINSSLSQYHENFNAYYNNAEPVGFYAFQDSFSLNQATASDNSWQTPNGIWTISNGAYSGIGGQGGAEERVLASADIGKRDLSLQARLFIANKVNNTDPRLGIFVHYTRDSSSHKWALTIHQWPNGTSYLELLDEFNEWLRGSNPSAINPCSDWTFPLGSFGGWYTFNLTISGVHATGWVSAPGQSQCTVTGDYQTSSPAMNGTGFGLYAGGYSTFFDDVLVAIVSPFTGSFYPNGAPAPAVHGALGGTAELTNSTGSIAPRETYDSYLLFGGLSQVKRRYDPAGGTTPQWLPTTMTYDALGNLKTLSDPLGNTTYYDYSSPGNVNLNAYLTNVTSVVQGTPSIRITRLYSYDSATGNILSTTDPIGNVTSYTYDLLGRPRTITYPITTGSPRGSFQYSYNDVANYVEITNENGFRTRQSYDGLGRLATTQPYSSGNVYATTTYTYNWKNEKVTETDPLGRVYSYSYDALGRLTRITKPDTNTTQVSYNDLNSTTLSANENLFNTCRTYDRLGRLLTVIENATASCQNGIATNYYYDGIGNLLKTVDPKSHATTNTYDNLGRLTRTAYPDSSTESFVYDKDGNLVQKLDRSGIPTVYSYDSLNRVTKMTYCGTQVTTDAYTYDRDGNILQFWNWNATINYAYDSRGRLLTEAYNVNTGSYPSNLTCGISGGGGGGSVASGTLITMQDGTKVPVQQIRVGDPVRTYDVISGRTGTAVVSEVKAVSVDNSLTIHTSAPLPFRTDYNPLFRLHVLVNNNVILKSVTKIQPGDLLYNYDQSKWVPVTKIDVEFGGSHTVYDLTTQPVTDFIANGYADCPKACPNRPSGGGGDTAPTVKSASNLTASPAGDPSYTVFYYYQGEVLGRISYPTNFNSFAVNYTYDDMGRVLTVYNPAVSNPSSYATFGYDKANEPISVSYGNGLVTSYNYDRLARLSLIKTVNGRTTLLQLFYSYYKTGTVSAVVGSSSDSNGGSVVVNEAYKYDALNRLTNGNVTSGSTRSTILYGYDNSGNRAWQNVNGAVTNYGYNADNFLSNSTGGGPSVIYMNNGNGDPLFKTILGTSSTAYSFGVMHRMYTASTGPIQGRYGYDGLNRRVVSVEGGVPTYYAYLGTEILYSFSGSTPTDNVYANGLLIAKVVSGGSTSPNYYHSDMLGSTRLVTDSSHNVGIVFSDNYQPYGQENGTPTGSAEAVKFTGRQYSSVTGFYYDFQRWYDPNIGRFNSVDPLPGHIRNPQSLNSYSYVLNQPTRLVDPSGLSWECFGQEDCGGGASGAGSGSSGSNTIAVNDLPSVEVSTNDLPANTLTPIMAAAGNNEATGVGTDDLVNTADFFSKAEKISRLQAGQAGHESLLKDATEQFGEISNTGTGQQRVVDANGRVYVPDTVGGNEAKFVRYQARTGQMRIAIQNAVDTNTQYTIYVRPGYPDSRAPCNIGFICK